MQDQEAYQQDVFSLPNIEIEAIPELTNFEYPKQLCVRLIREGSKEFESVLNGADVSRNAFRQIFPEVVESRNTTHMDDAKQFVRWNNGENIVQVELEPYNAPTTSNNDKQNHYDYIAVGGPAAIMAAVLYGIRKHETGQDAKFLYGVTSRFDSNHDGSAYYVHERDCFAVYCNPSNRGLFVVYEDARKRLAKSLFMDNFVKEIKERRNYLKFNMNYANITPGVVFKIFIPNQYYAYTDLIKTRMGNPQDTFLAQTAQHSARKDKIINLVEKYTGKHSIFIPDSDKHQALHIVFNQKEECIDHFHWLTNFLPIPFYELSQEQRKNLSSVMETYLRFPRDGIVNPFAFEAMKKILAKQGAQVMQNFKLSKITLAKDERGDLAVKKITWTDSQTNQQHELQTDKLIFSLGPSSVLVAQPPDYSLWQHAKDTLIYKVKDMISPSVTVSADSFSSLGEQTTLPSFRPTNLPYYKPTLKSMYRHFLNIVEEPFGGNELYKKFMWAAGSTSVIQIGVDLNKVSEEQLSIFRHFLGGENHHWTPIAERQVTDKQGKRFQFFAIQMTGGGNFPTRHMSPDIVLNLLISTERIFDLEKKKNEKAVTYDLVQTRGCGRAVSAKNAINFVVLGKGAVGAYALGGLGMTTMYSNGELMNELVELREQLANGKIDQQEFQDRLSTGELNSPYSQQLYGVDHVLGGVNYTKLVDDINKTARKLGHDDSLSENEKMTHAIIGAGCVATATAGFWLKQKRNKAAKPKTMAVAQQFNKQQTYLKDLTVKTKQRAGNTVAFLKNRVQNLKTKAGTAMQKLLNLVKK